jgi:hypothetical protein
MIERNHVQGQTVIKYSVFLHTVSSTYIPYDHREKDSKKMKFYLFYILYHSPLSTSLFHQSNIEHTIINSLDSS